MVPAVKASDDPHRDTISVPKTQLYPKRLEKELILDIFCQHQRAKRRHECKEGSTERQRGAMAKKKTTGRIVHSFRDVTLNLLGGLVFDRFVIAWWHRHAAG